MGSIEKSKVVLSITESEKTKPARDRPNRNRRNPTWAKFRKSIGKPSSVLQGANKAGPGRPSDCSNRGEPTRQLASTDMHRPRQAVPKAEVEKPIHAKLLGNEEDPSKFVSKTERASPS